MTRSERRILFDTSILGMLLTFLVLGADLLGWMNALELPLYDIRARRFQYFTPPPTDRLVHMDIDDRSLEAIGAWPWPRSTMAKVVDELSLAGAKAVAFDIIYSEPQPPTIEQVPSTQPSGSMELRRIDHDAIFADSLRRFGRAIVPMSLNLSLARAQPPLYRAMVMEIYGNPQVTREELFQRLAGRGDRQDDVRVQVNDLYISARREAIFERIEAEARDREISADELRRRIMPDVAAEVMGGSPLARVIDEQYARYQAVRALRRFSRPAGTGFPPLLSTRDEQATVRRFTEVAGATGYVDYLPLSDGVVRTVPLFAEHREHVFPQIGLSLACAMLDVDVRQVRVRPDRLEIPRGDGPAIVIPVQTRTTTLGKAGMFVDIPWFGRSGPGAWENMYDHGTWKQPRQHLAIQYAWEPVQMQMRIRGNNENAAQAIAALVDLLSDMGIAEPKATWKAMAPADLDGPAAYAPMLELVLKHLREMEFDKQLESLKPADFDAMKPDEREAQLALWRAYHTAKRVLENNPQLAKELAERRAMLHRSLSGKAVLIGYIAVGAIADVVPTSLHPRCPGVVVHGVIFNSIMTGDFWRPLPGWATALAVLLLGLATTGFVARLSPWKALATTLALGAMFYLFNGLFLFDRHNLLLGQAGPLTAMSVVWAGGTMARYILEQGERRKIERRFRNRIDPALVDYFKEHDDARFDGQAREMTVVFTDLQGFTTLSEQLKDRVVPLLNEYMALMVPLIRRYRGFLNKLLGDGIMYFFGAPAWTARHARDAVDSVLAMQQVMVDFNASLRDRGLPELRLRAGLTSGEMVVGDCGTGEGSILHSLNEYSDYTVIGDEVNTASRLEGANKSLGSSILVNDRCRQLVGDAVLFRPMGRIRVKGKQEGVMTYEPLAWTEQATEAQKRLAELTAAVVEAFMGARFEECLSACRRMDEQVGASKLTALYAELCGHHLAESTAEFDGQIVLTEK